MHCTRGGDGCYEGLFGRGCSLTSGPPVLRRPCAASLAAAFLRRICAVSLAASSCMSFSLSRKVMFATSLRSSFSLADCVWRDSIALVLPASSRQSSRAESAALRSSCAASRAAASLASAARALSASFDERTSSVFIESKVRCSASAFGTSASCSDRSRSSSCRGTTIRKRVFE
ncbi:hypothetical protein M885DRAFT_504349 [Pelagophyceae sp. CCMP2097]|nr:hypothetical protein M885DRAFT_504349 [Pelagophyceae sp. CCMP2097]